jgi:hypothetical protein
MQRGEEANPDYNNFLAGVSSMNIGAAGPSLDRIPINSTATTTPHTPPSTPHAPRTPRTRHTPNRAPVPPILHSPGRIASPSTMTYTTERTPAPSSTSSHRIRRNMRTASSVTVSSDEGEQNDDADEHVNHRHRDSVQAEPTTRTRVRHGQQGNLAAEQGPCDPGVSGYSG